MSSGSTKALKTHSSEKKLKAFEDKREENNASTSKNEKY